MASRAARQIVASLKQKGFRSEGKRDHDYLTLWLNDKQQIVRTKISRGVADYGDELLGRVAVQLQLRRQDLLRLIDCPLDGAGYLELLYDGRVIQRPAED